MVQRGRIIIKNRDSRYTKRRLMVKERSKAGKITENKDGDAEKNYSIKNSKWKGEN